MDNIQINLTKVLTVSNALVIVHPDLIDLGIPYETFLENLVFATTFMEGSDKQTYVIPYFSAVKLKKCYPTSISDMWKIEDKTNFFYPDDLLNKISTSNATPVEHLNLGVGGIWYQNCPADFAVRITNQYVGPIPQKSLSGVCHASKKIRYAEIIELLSI